MKHSSRLLFAALALLGGTSLARAQAAIDFGSAAGFSVLGGAGITFTATTTLTGDVGTFPTATIAGADNIIFLSGVNHAGDATTQAAKIDLTTAYTDASNRTSGTIASQLGGTVLTPGVYSAGTFAITGNLTLNGSGVYIFQSSSTLDAAANSQVLLTGGATADNVYWQVGSSATFLSDATIVGNVMAFASITVGTGTDVIGRLFAQTGAVSFAGNNSVAAPTAIPEPATSVALAAGMMGLLVVVRRWRAGSAGRSIAAA
ncbi:MAG: hypothetical protein C0518_11060 [Opitutus sp.]|nr:hypothetical protein [Opitutus sp.]